MAKSRKEKKKLVADLTADLNEAKSVIVTNYKGITVPELEELRSELRSAGAKYGIVKNSLFTLAQKKSDLGDVNISDMIEGPIALALGFEDEVAPAKIIHDASKKIKALEVKGGILDGELLDDKKVAALAKLPTKDELIAKTVGTIKAPITGFVNVLAGNMRGLVNVLNGIKDQKA